MSILIKGAEMPKNCEECPCIAWRYDDDSPACCVLQKDISDYTKRLADCPLVEIETPHGGLVDLNLLISNGVIDDYDLHNIPTLAVIQNATVIEEE